MKTPDTCPTLTQAILTELLARQGEAKELVVSLSHDLPAFRRMAPRAGTESPKLTLETLLRPDEPHWRMATRFSRLLAAGIEKHSASLGLRNWGEATLPISVALATRCAQRLLEQLGCADPQLLDWGRRPAGFDELASGTMQSIGEYETFTIRWSQTIADSVMKRAASATLGSPPKILLIHTADSQIWASWLDAKGDLLWREELQTFVSLMARESEAAYTADLVRLLQVRDGFRTAGPKALRAISPRLADAAEEACSQKTVVAVRLGSGLVRASVPVDVWLYMSTKYMEGETAGCALSIHRRNHEYILGGPGLHKPLYYFPPILLVARLTFSAARVGPRLLLPIVRQPANGYSWVHPYTGGMERSWTSETIMHPADEPAQAEASPQAVALFPNLTQRTPFPMERSMCLRGQEGTIATISARLRLELLREQGDVLSCITAVHDVARVGLTRSHHLNTSPPRIEMNEDNMHYPLLGRPVTGDLARRIFPYDPRVVLAAG